MPVGKRGGSSPGQHRGGRKKGQPNTLTRTRKLNAAVGMQFARDEKRTPLQFLLGVQNWAEWVDEIPEEQFPVRFQAAVAAAPYCHARLAAVAVQQVPDASAERRKSMLAGLSYQQRQAIAGILAAANVLEDGGDEADTPVVVERSEDQKR